MLAKYNSLNTNVGMGDDILHMSNLANRLVKSLRTSWMSDSPLYGKVYSYPHETKLYFDVEGLPESDIECYMKGHYLFVKGHTEHDGMKREVSYTWHLPHNIDNIDFTANVKNGMLYVTIHHPSEAEKDGEIREIEIK